MNQHPQRLWHPFADMARTAGRGEPQRTVLERMGGAPDRVAKRLGVAA